MRSAENVLKNGYNFIAVVFVVKPDRSYKGKCAGVVQLRPFDIPESKQHELLKQTFAMDGDGKLKS